MKPCLVILTIRNPGSLFMEGAERLLDCGTKVFCPIVPIMVHSSDRLKKTLKNEYLFFQVTEPESYKVLQVELTYTKSVGQDVVKEVEIESFENLPIDLDGTANRWTDLHSDGIPCILTE